MTDEVNYLSVRDIRNSMQAETLSMTAVAKVSAKGFYQYTVYGMLVWTTYTVYRTGYIYCTYRLYAGMPSMQITVSVHGIPSIVSIPCEPYGSVFDSFTKF